MYKVIMPQKMNETFARAFNSRDISNLISLYEDNAILRIDSDKNFIGKKVISLELQHLLQLPGKMISSNNFCIEYGDIALLRADYTIIDTNGTSVLSGSSAEVVRQQSDGCWLYIIDHAMGSTLPRIEM